MYNTGDLAVFRISGALHVEEYYRISGILVDISGDSIFTHRVGPIAHDWQAKQLASSVHEALAACLEEKQSSMGCARARDDLLKPRIMYYKK